MYQPLNLLFPRIDDLEFPALKFATRPPKLQSSSSLSSSSTSSIASSSTITTFPHPRRPLSRFSWTLGPLSQPLLNPTLQALLPRPPALLLLAYRRQHIKRNLPGGGATRFSPESLRWVQPISRLFPSFSPTDNQQSQLASSSDYLSFFPFVAENDQKNKRILENYSLKNKKKKQSFFYIVDISDDHTPP